MLSRSRKLRTTLDMKMASGMTIHRCGIRIITGTSRRSGT
jgi:hypothetical protein